MWVDWTMQFDFVDFVFGSFFFFFNSSFLNYYMREERIDPGIQCGVSKNSTA